MSFVPRSSDPPNSELRTAIDADGVAGDPTCVVRGEERHNRADIIWLADPLERLHAEDGSLALVGLDEVRHVGVDHARRDCVNADAPRPESCREVLHQRVDRALRGRVGRQGADGRRRPGGRDEKHSAGVDALARPMPREAPVTSAVLPFRLGMFIVLVVAEADSLDELCRRGLAGLYHCGRASYYSVGTASGTTARAALAQSTSFCTVGAPLR